MFSPSLSLEKRKTKTKANKQKFKNSEYDKNTETKQNHPSGQAPGGGAKTKWTTFVIRILLYSFI